MNTAITATIAASILSLVSACATVTEDTLEGQSDNKRIVEVATAPEATFRSLLIGTKRCFATGGPTVTSEYYSDIKEGRVTVMLSSGTAGLSRTMATTVVTPREEGGSRVTSHFAKRQGFAWLAEASTAWAQGKPGGCQS